jgi:hypothetical protein
MQGRAARRRQEIHCLFERPPLKIAHHRSERFQRLHSQFET